MGLEDQLNAVQEELDSAEERIQAVEEDVQREEVIRHLVGRKERRNDRKR